MAADRDHFVLATKYSMTERREDPNFGGNHRENLVRSLEGSLQRLETDHVDLLWPHMWDGMTPVEEVLRAMDDMVRAGKVLYVPGRLGVSDSFLASDHVRGLIFGDTYPSIDNHRPGQCSSTPDPTRSAIFPCGGGQSREILSLLIVGSVFLILPRLRRRQPAMIS